MTSPQALTLGLLQGLTEFLPISSSGHLVLAEHWLGLAIDPASLQGFDVILHSATLLAILIVYRSVWWNIGASVVKPKSADQKWRKLLVLLIIGTIPAGLAGILLQDWIAQTFRAVETVGAALICTGLLLVVTDLLSSGNRSFHTVSPGSALKIGILQALALIPGLSRSGLTISAGRLVGLSTNQAIDLAFLLATPAIAGATILTILNIISGEVLLPDQTVIATGFAASLCSSVAAIYVLKYVVSKIKLGWFALYLVPIGCLLLFA